MFGKEKKMKEKNERKEDEKKENKWIFIFHMYVWMKGKKEKKK